jgi:hypothetical protein
MKFKTLIPLVTAVCCIANCGAEKAANNQKQPPGSPPANASSAQRDDIVGEWEMVGSVVDTNDNLQVDEAERKALKAPSFKDYMKLNRDGSGEFTVAQMPGRYEITVQGGKRVLTWYDKAEGRHRIGTILKVTRDELHIKEPGGRGMFVWKRR